MNAQEGGTATFTRDASINVKSGGILTISAPHVVVVGGAVNRVMSNTFANGHPGSSGEIGFNSHGAGKATATLTSEVNLSAATDVILDGDDTLAIVGGAGNQLFVGAARIHGGFSGQRWNGGQANLSLNTSVTVSAGRDLHLSGSSIQVLGMGFAGGSFDNQANVRGGSSSAVAKLSLVGDATLSAKRDIIITGESASIVGGSLGNLRADHASGNVTILGSADATLKAGRDVSVTLANLTVAGVNVNSSHSGGILVDAHADKGFASVTGHADANIIAGRNVINGSGSMEGLNVIGGQFVDAVTLGLANNQKATATANANITAGGSITLKGDADLNVAGGLFDSAAITNTFSNGASASGQRVASLQARAGITAKGAVSLTFTGDGVIAGGDSLTAKASLSGDRFITGTVTADTGVQIKGSNVTISLGGNLLARGGSGANVRAIGIGTDVKATATGSANAVIAATGTTTTTGNLSITTGTGSNGGDASFIGGSAGKSSVQVFGSGNAATGTAHDDVSVTATKSITLTVNGALKVAGGPGAENSALVLAGLPGGILTPGSIGAASGTALATVTGKVAFAAGTTLTVHATGDVNILGGSRGGSSAIVAVAGGSSGTNGKHDTAKLTVDTSVSLSAKGAVTITADGGTGSVHIATFVPDSNSSGFVPPVFVAASSFAVTNHNVASANINESVKITGKTVTLTPDFSGDLTFSSGGLTMDGTITVTGHPVIGFHPQVATPKLHFNAESLQVLPESGTGSFGGQRDLGGTSLSAPAAPATSVSDGVQLPAPSITSLDTLQVQGLVVNLVTLMSADQPKPEVQGTLFVPSTIATVYDAAFPSSCSALVLRADAHSRCTAGGK